MVDNSKIVLKINQKKNLIMSRNEENLKNKIKVENVNNKAKDLNLALNINVRTEENDSQDKYKENKPNCLCLLLQVFIDLFLGKAINYNDYYYSKYKKTFKKHYFALEPVGKKEFIKSIKDIITIDNYFKEALFEDFINLGIIAEREQFIYFLTKTKRKYYCKAIEVFIIEICFFSLYLILRFLLFLQEYTCVNKELIVSNSDNYDNQNYWNCEKFQVCEVRKEIGVINIIRVSYYLLFYVFYFIFKLYFLLTFNNCLKKFQNYPWIIIYKILEYGCLIAIIFFELKDDQKCFRAENNLFVKSKDNNLNIALSILDILLQLIK